MHPAQIIARKRDGYPLTSEQISAFVSGFTCGEIPDYQMSALAMAIYLRGMEPSETTALTQQMLASGTTLTWASSAPKVDKHSTGGIGDKVSLVLAPLLACCGLQVPMISGRGLGPTGGTLDKLESIPGFRTDLSTREIQEMTERVGCVISGATDDIAPADQKLYRLRDVTATVASIPLITASIMSKKLAEVLDALVLDVKYGNGAFMKSLDDARALAHSLVQTGRRMGVRTSAMITDMNQPLGRMIGNAVEVDEAVDALQGKGPEDLIQLVSELSCELLELTGKVSSRDQGTALLGRSIESGEAWKKLQQMVAAQGGDLDASRIVAPATELTAEHAGFVSRIDTQQLGQTIIELGGGRRIASDKIDHSVGLEMLVRLGDTVEKNQPLVRVFAHPQQASNVAQTVKAAVSISDVVPDPGPLIVERITE